MEGAPITAGTAAQAVGSAGTEAIIRSFGAFLVSERVLQRIVAGWFFLLAFYLTACVVARAANLDLHAPNAGALLADLASRFCTLLFYFMAAWITLVRATPLAKARGIAPRIATFLGVMLLFALPLLPRLAAPPAWLLVLSAALALLGGAMSVYVLHWLGESFSLVPQARRLVTGGPYAIVRHPLYLAEETAIIGIFLPFWSPAAIGLFALHLAVQLMRMSYEEGVLRQTFPEYAEYAAHTMRVVPGVW